MLLLPNFSPARVEGGVCHIDRKVHTGATLYADSLNLEIVCLAPTLREKDLRMDFIDVPVDELHYRVETIECDRSFHPLPHEMARIERLVQQSEVVYGRGLGTTAFARKHGVPYIVITECNLKTNLRIAKLDAPSRLRGLKRQIGVLGEFALEMRDIARSHSVHCNGYPTFHQSRYVHSDCLLYLDSRMSANDIISEEALEDRLTELSRGRRPRLFFSGRYTAIKGALDVVEVGLELLRLGVDFELHLYGRGDLREEMVARARESDGRITVHEAVPFPELVEIALRSDLFICCHVQDDPSCTYLETLGAGMPIVGYANAMWRELAAESGAGTATPMGDVKACAREIERLLRDHAALRLCSERARAFAQAHTFEKEFERRIAPLRAFASAGD